MMKHKRKRAMFDLVQLAEVLLSRGRLEEARAVARTALRGFVSLAESQRVETAEMLKIFLTAIEVFAGHLHSESVDMRNALIRLYTRLLHVKAGAFVDWDHIEHPLLRSCVLHGSGGGNAGALADLQRKSKIWQINASADSYRVTRRGGDDGPVRRKEVTAGMVAQRKSALISQWLIKLSSVR